MSVQNLPDHVLQELTLKRNDLFLAGLRHTLIDVELVALIMDLGMLAVHEEIERRRQEQLRASHIDDVLQTACNENVEVVQPQGMDAGLRAVIGRMYEASKDLQEAVPEVWDRAEVTDLGPLDVPDEPF